MMSNDADKEVAQVSCRVVRASRGVQLHLVLLCRRSAKSRREQPFLRSTARKHTQLTCPTVHSVDAAHDLNQRQASALDELRLFRTTLDSLKARLPALEYFVANSSLKEEDEDAELDRIVRSFGDPVTTIAADEGSVAGDPQTASEPSSKRPRTSLGGGGNQNGLHALANKGKGKQKQEADEGEAGVEASVNLEFYALGRPRVWAEPHLSTSAVTEDADMIGGAAAGPSSSPSHRNAVLPSVPEGQPESPVSLFPNGEALRYAAPTRVQEEIILQQGVDVYGFHASPISECCRGFGLADETLARSARGRLRIRLSRTSVCISRSRRGPLRPCIAGLAVGLLCAPRRQRKTRHSGTAGPDGPD